MKTLAIIVNKELKYPPISYANLQITQIEQRDNHHVILYYLLGTTNIGSLTIVDAEFLCDGESITAAEAQKIVVSNHGTKRNINIMRLRHE
jgi:hypothetical protein